MAVPVRAGIIAITAHARPAAASMPVARRAAKHAPTHATATVTGHIVVSAESTLQKARAATAPTAAATQLKVSHAESIMRRRTATGATSVLRIKASATSKKRAARRVRAPAIAHLPHRPDRTARSATAHPANSALIKDREGSRPAPPVATVMAAALRVGTRMAAGMDLPRAGALTPSTDRLHNC